jgi:hypothetical protein
MKLRSLTRHSCQRSALLPAAPLVLGADQGVRATGRESRPTDHTSLPVNCSSPIATILIGCSPIKNSRNSRVISVKSISHWPKKACFLAHILRSPTADHASPTADWRVTGRGSLSPSTAHESAASSAPTHGIIVLSYARRGSLTSSPMRGRQQATGAARNRLRPAAI